MREIVFFHGKYIGVIPEFQGDTGVVQSLTEDAVVCRVQFDTHVGLTDVFSLFSIKDWESTGLAIHEVKIPGRKKPKWQLVNPEDLKTLDLLPKPRVFVIEKPKPTPPPPPPPPPPVIDEATRLQLATEARRARLRAQLEGLKNA